MMSRLLSRKSPKTECMDRVTEGVSVILYLEKSSTVIEFSRNGNIDAQTKKLWINTASLGEGEILNQLSKNS